MRNLIDTMFGPVLNWLTDIISRLQDLSIPLARPLNLSNYFGYFNLLGAYWKTFITTTLFLAFIYFIVFIINANMGLFDKFKNKIKWW